MDGRRFDGLARALAEPRTRRGVLALLGASLATAFTGGVGSAKSRPDRQDNPGKSKCYGGGSHCTNGKQCCSGTCTNRQCAPESGPEPEPECVTAATCPGEDTPCATRTCVDGVCGVTFAISGTGCPGGLCDGNGACVECLTEVECGGRACVNNVCEPAQPCTEQPDFGQPCTAGLGACERSGVLACAANGIDLECDAVPGLPLGVETCNGVDDNCDGQIDEGVICPTVAHATGICQDGACAFVCDEGRADCNADWESDGCETDIFFDAENCGACGVVCPIANTAIGSILEYVCYGGRCACFADGDCPAGQGCFDASMTAPGLCQFV